VSATPGARAVDPLEISRLRDPYGVLSVYADADPRERLGRRPAWVVAVQNGLDAIRERVKLDGDRSRWTALLRRLEQLEPELSVLMDPRQPGRGRALFAAVDGGDVHRVALQMPISTRVVLGDVADLTPLLVALDRGRPAGLVVVSQASVDVLEQELGSVAEVESIPIEPDISEWRELRGPTAPSPATAQHTAAQRDRFEHRVEEHRARLLDGAAGRLAQVVSRRRWDRVVVAGDRRLAQPLADAAARSGADVSVVERTLTTASPAEVADALAPELESANVRRESRLVSRALDAALSGGPGALGLGDVLTALEDGRVDHLLFDQAREYAGRRAPDGRLVPEGEVPPGLAAEALEPEPALAGRMIERALAIDARVTPLSAAGAEPLAGHQGIAALLRWR
jgi:hypothetical protein